MIPKCQERSDSPECQSSKNLQTSNVSLFLLRPSRIQFCLPFSVVTVCQNCYSSPLVFMAKGVITCYQGAFCTMSLGTDTQPLFKL